MKRFIFILTISALLLVSVSACSDDKKSSSTTSSTTTTAKSSNSSVDLTKLPLGDDMYSSSPKVGYIFSCRSSYDSSEGGAGTDGPWIDAVNKTWDSTSKVTVDGDVKWDAASATFKVSGSNRIISSNALPANSNTGTFPIASSDDAYQYDRNPNSIKAQTISYTLPVNPTEADEPECVSGEVGISVNGVPIFDGFDAGGRDAVAHEVQDTCGGHPEMAGKYHYHNLSTCLEITEDADGHSALIGYALDGFGIFGPTEGGKTLRNADLDECHGHASDVLWEGKEASMYHYHATAEFPYTVACFKADAVKPQSTGGPGAMGGPGGPGNPGPPR